MCQLIFCNTHNDELNQKLHLLMSSMGSTVHKHGWGVLGGTSGKFDKCAVPAYLTLDSGTYIRKAIGPLMGHIRMASAGVPVNDANAHPFHIKNKAVDIIQFHNGTLTPKDESKFTMTFEEETFNETTKVKSVSKVKFSDSWIFLGYLAGVMETNKGDFVKSLQDAMKEFYGKFALMYYLPKTKEQYIVRGKSADLHIIHFTDSNDKDAKVTGYAIDTSSDVLEASVIMLSNLLQIEGKEPLYFTAPKLLKEETIYKVEDFDVVSVAEIKENVVPVKVWTNGRSYYSGADEGADFFTGGANTGVTKNIVNYAPTKAYDLGKEMFEFMEDYSFSFIDLQNLFFALYGFSFYDADYVLLNNFVKKVLESFKNRTTKNIRKQIKAALKERQMPFEIYKKYEFPWMLNSKADQMEIVQQLRKRI